MHINRVTLTASVSRHGQPQGLVTGSGRLEWKHEIDSAINEFPPFSNDSEFGRSHCRDMCSIVI